MITAANNIENSSQELRHTLQVRGKIGDLTVELRPAKTTSGVLNISTEQEFEISVSSSEAVPINYTFYFNDTKPPSKEYASDGKTKVSYTYVVYTSYNVTVQASIGDYSENQTVFVQASRCGPPAIYMYGIYTREFPMTISRASKVSLSPTVNKKDGCDISELKYAWHIYKSSTETPVLDKSKKDSRTFEIHPRSLDEGNYTVNLTIDYEMNSYFFETHIEVKRSDPFATILGGSVRTVPYDTSRWVVLDASKSSDPEDPKATDLKFTWKCKFINMSMSPDPGSVCRSEAFTPLDKKTAQLNYSTVEFSENVTYVFQVTVQTKDSRTAIEKQEIRISPMASPSVEIRLVHVTARGIGLCHGTAALHKTHT